MKENVSCVGCATLSRSFKMQRLINYIQITSFYQATGRNLKQQQYLNCLARNEINQAGPCRLFNFFSNVVVVVVATRENP